MKLPNNYGTIYKLSGNRRKPWIARKMVGTVPDPKTRRMRIQYITIGYYEKKSEALNALAQFNAEPYDPVKRAKTLSEVYEAWSAEYFPTLKETGHYKAAWKVLEPYGDRALADLTLDDLQFILNNSGKNIPTLKNVKVLLTLMYDYAVVHEIVLPIKKEFVRYLAIKGGNPRQLERKTFTADEIASLWASQTPLNDVTLVLLYTGLRVSELCNLRPSDVDIDAQTIHIREAKTPAGIRDVPIGDKLVPVFRRYWSRPHPSPVSIRGRMKRNLGHLPHDTRHTFASMAAEAGIDQRLIDAMLGHSTGNTALKVYTHFSIEKKLEAVNNLLEIC